MPNFEAQVRTSYRDVRGLVLSCTRDDVVTYPDNPGYVKEWLNRAPGLPSQPAIRQPIDPITYEGGRVSNLRAFDLATAPALVLTGGGESRVSFERSRSSFLQSEFTLADLPLTPGGEWAFGFQVEVGADVSIGQTLFSTDGDELLIHRRNGAGNAECLVDVGSTIVAGDMSNGTHLYTSATLPAVGATWERNGVAYGTGSDDTVLVPNGARFYLGRSQAGNYLDGILDQIHIWACMLSPATRDFIWQSINADGIDYATEVRAPMNKPLWTDLTGDLSASEIDRLNPITGLPFRYIRVELPTATPHRIQIAASIDGVVEPDSELGGDLFDFNWIEVPGPPVVYPARITPDTGWSAVFDFDVEYEGHYTLQITRDNGGSIILHFDVQVI